MMDVVSLLLLNRLFFLTFPEEKNYTTHCIQLIFDETVNRKVAFNESLNIADGLYH